MKNRTKLPSCGEYEKRNGPASPEQLRKNRCSLDALDQGRQAELITTVHDGGPIFEYLRVLSADRIEVFVDATRDVEHGGPEARWSRWLCEDLRETNGYLERVGCREIPLEDAGS